MRSPLTWIAVVLATIAVVAVSLVCANLWVGVGDTQISLIGWLSMGFGVVLTLAVGCGLMALVFISNRRGYDEAARLDRKDP